MTQPTRETVGDVVIQDHGGASYFLVRVTGPSSSERIVAEADLDTAMKRACKEAGLHRVWLLNVATQTHSPVSCPKTDGG